MSHLLDCSGLKSSQVVSLKILTDNTQYAWLRRPSQSPGEASSGKLSGKLCSIVVINKAHYYIRQGGVLRSVRFVYSVCLSDDDDSFGLTSLLVATLKFIDYNVAMTFILIIIIIIITHIDDDERQQSLSEQIYLQTSLQIWSCRFDRFTRCVIIYTFIYIIYTIYTQLILGRRYNSQRSPVTVYRSILWRRRSIAPSSAHVDASSLSLAFPRCLSVCRITAKVISWFHWNLVLWLSLLIRRIG